MFSRAAARLTLRSRKRASSASSRPRSISARSASFAGLPGPCSASSMGLTSVQAKRDGRTSRPAENKASTTVCKGEPPETSPIDDIDETYRARGPPGGAARLIVHGHGARSATSTTTAGANTSRGGLDDRRDENLSDWRYGHHADRRTEACCLSVGNSLSRSGGGGAGAPS